MRASAPRRRNRDNANDQCVAVARPVARGAWTHRSNCTVQPGTANGAGTCTTGNCQGFGHGSGPMGGGHQTKTPGMRTGVTSASGRLPSEVIQRVVRQNHDGPLNLFKVVEQRTFERWTSQSETQDIRKFIDQLPMADRLALLGVRVYPPANNADFANFARKVVERYGPGGTFWANRPDLTPRPLRAAEIGVADLRAAAEGHGAEAQFGDLEPGVAQTVVFHRRPP